MSIDSTTRFMDLMQTFERHREAETSLAALTALTWLAYTAMALAALAPISAHFVPALPHHLAGAARKRTVTLSPKP